MVSLQCTFTVKVRNTPLVPRLELASGYSVRVWMHTLEPTASRRERVKVSEPYTYPKMLQIGLHAYVC